MKKKTSRLDRIEMSIAKLAKQINSRFDNFENGINTRINNLEKDINARLDLIEKRLDYNHLKKLPENR